VVITQGDVCWYDFAEPKGSEPGYTRPVVVVQGDHLNRAKIGTAVCVMLTSNVRMAAAAGNVLLPKKSTGLEFDSVANVSQIATVDRDLLRDHTGRLPPSRLDAILRGIDIVLGR
jgi:mRNA interferase MazF